MLLLNAPIPRRDPAAVAARMAIDMQRGVQDIIQQWRALGHAIGFGIGIATGEATVGRIGYEGRIDYTAIGPVVNLAARLCSLAVDGQVIIDDVTAAAVAERCQSSHWVVNRSRASRRQPRHSPSFTRPRAVLSPVGAIEAAPIVGFV